MVFDDDDDTTGKSAKGRTRAAISDRRTRPSDGKRHKSSMNIRTAVLYRKNFNTLLEESVSECTHPQTYIPDLILMKGVANLPPDVPTYLAATAPPPKELPRLLCSVCGYWGRYKCLRCAAPYCDLSCRGVHDETRCEKRVV